MKTVKTINTNDMLKALKKDPNWKCESSPQNLVNYEKAKLIIESEKFVEEFKAENKIVCERLRDGFIGELVYTDKGTSFIQTVRGKPYGTIVAISSKDVKNIVTGISYLDPEDMDFGHPIVGMAIALRRAIKRKEDGKTGVEKRWVKSKARKQVNHFEKRALSYFIPEVYSYSKGTNPVVYDDFKEIHERRKMILGK